MKSIICNSGIKGWQGKLREVYDNFEEFLSFSSTFNIANRLGFISATDAWSANPTIQGSVIPSDLKRVC